MSKRKRDAEPEVAPEAQPVAETLPELPTRPAAIDEQKPESAPEELPYEERRWNNLPQYVCRECGFDTLELPAMLQHLAARHAPPAPPREPRTILVTDRFGNVIEEREV